MLSEVFAFFCKSCVKLAWFSKVMGEPSIAALVTAVHKEWAGDSKNFQRQLIPRTSPVDDHASNGAIEAMVHSLGRGSGSLDSANFYDSAVAGPTSELSCDQVAEHRLKS